MIDFNKIFQSYKKQIRMSDWPDNFIYNDKKLIEGFVRYMRTVLLNRYEFVKYKIGD